MIRFSLFLIVLSQNVGKHAGNVFISQKYENQDID